MPVTTHPKHCYDCTNCKLNWCCGPKCACNYVHGLNALPWATGERAKEVRAAINTVHPINARKPIDGIIEN